MSSFGTESAALLKVMADVDPAIPVIFLDTGWLFEETLAYRDTLIAQLGLRDVRSIKPLEETLSREDPDRELWFSDPDACCRIRKVEPLKRALAPFSAWINGRKRFQGGARAAIPVVEDDGGRLKFNPFANVSREEIAAIYARLICRRIRSPPAAFCRSAACPAPAAPRRTRTPAPAAGAAVPRPNAASTPPRRPDRPPFRHARASCRASTSLVQSREKTWMAGTKPGMTKTSSFCSPEIAPAFTFQPRLVCNNGA